jgi:hypothetical protein
MSVLLFLYIIIIIITSLLMSPLLTMAELAYWWEYSPTTQEVEGSIPVHCKHLCLFVLSLCVSMYNMYVFTKNIYTSMYLSVI